ncbi:MAG: MopE-related protein [Hyalangium sp.]
MKKLSLVTLLVTLSACKSDKLEGEAIHAKVVLAPAVSASCVLFEVRDPSDHSVLDKSWLPRSGKNELQVAIFRGSLPQDVELAARPYQGGACTKELGATTANGVYVTGSATFVTGQVTQAHELSLQPGTDADSDTYVDLTSGGGDCNDSSVAVSPGASEICTDQVDLNCDGKKGCEASGCAANACIGPPTALMLTLPVSAVPAGTCTSGAVLVMDSSGRPTHVTEATSVSLQAAPAGGIAFFSDSTCTTRVTSVSLSANEGSAGFFIQGQLAGAVTVTASSSGLTQGSQSVQVTPGTGNRLVFTSSAQTVTAGACSQGVQVQSRDAQGNAAPVSALTTVALGASPSTGFKFYSDASCTTEVTSTNIAAAASTAGFYFKGTKAGSVMVTATAPSFTGDSQTETIKPGPPAALSFSGPVAAQAGDCSTAVTVSLLDNQGNPTTATAATNVTLAAAASGKPLTFSTNGCSTNTTSVSIASGSGSTTFSYKGTQAGAATINGTSGTLTSAALNVTINAAPPTVAVFTTTAQALLAGACSAVTTVQLQDSFGNAATVSADTTMGLTASPPDGFQFFSSAGCGGAPVTSLPLLTGSGSASFYFMGTRSGTVAVTASVGAISKSQNETINPAAPTVLALSTASQTITAGACTQITVRAQDVYGNASNVSGPQAVNLSASPLAGFAIYPTNTCGTATATVSISSGQSSATFYVKGNTPGGVTVTASKTPQFSDGTLALTVNPGPPTKLAFKTGAQTVQVGNCSGITTVEVQDSLSNSTTVTTTTTVTLSATGTTSFYSDATCATSLPSLSIPAGQGSASFYFKDTAVEPVTITAASAGLGNVTQTETINPVPADMLAYTTPERSATAGSCSGVVTVQTQASGSPTTVISATPVTPSATGLTFYSNNTCTTQVTSINIAAGQGSVSFYFKGTTAGMVVLTSSSPGLASAIQNATITAGSPSKLVFTTPARTTVAGACSAVVTVQSSDTFDNASNVTLPVTVNLSASGTPTDGNFKFYTDASCSTTAVTSVSIPAGQSSASFYYKPEKARTATLTASATLFTNGTQDHTILPAGSSVLSFSTSTPAQTQLAGTCALRTVESRDAYANLTTDPLTLTLSASATAEFFSDSSCTTLVTTVPITAGNSSASFYFKGYTGGINANGTVTLTASATGPTPANQTETLIPTVRTGTCALSGAAKSTTCTITPGLTNGNRAFLVFQSTTQNTNSNNANIRCRLNSLTQVICERGGGGGSAANIRWAVAEFPNGVVTQNLPQDCVADTTSVTLATNVVTDRTFLMISGERNVSGQDSSVPRLAELTSATQAQIRKTASAGCGGTDASNLQVIDYPGASVQRGLTSLATTVASTQINLSSSVALDRSILLYSYLYDSTTTKICDRLVRGELTNSGANVTFTRGDGDTSANCTAPNISSISYEVVQFPVGTLVQQVTQQLAAGALSANITLPTAVDVSRTIVTAGGQWSSGQVHGESRYSGGEVVAEGRAQASLSANGTTLTLTREASTASATFTVYVVQFKP